MSFSSPCYLTWRLWFRN